MVVAAVVDEVAGVLPSAQHVDASALCLGELLSLTQHLTRELTGRLARPDFVESLDPVTPSEVVSSAEAVTLPLVQEQVAALMRVVEGAATAVAGHTARVFEDPQARRRWLGLPQGKTGFRSSADFVEKTLHTPARQTRERENRASQHLAGDRSSEAAGPESSLSELSEALWSGAVDPSVVDVITRTLGDARRAAAAARAPKEWVLEKVSSGEVELMGRARCEPPGVMVQVCKRWLVRFKDALERTTGEPPAGVVDQGRAARFVREENGLFLWHLFLTQSQHEIFKTVASAGANPRARKNQRGRSESSPEGAESAANTSGRGQDLFSLFDQAQRAQQARGHEAHENHNGQAVPAADASGASEDEDEVFCADLAPWVERGEERNRRQVDAVITALSAALRIKDSGLPDTGGYAPQVMAVIDYDTLAGRLLDHPDPPPPPEIPTELLRPGEPGYEPPGKPPPGGVDLRGSLVSTAGFSGPIDPRVIRAWACDGQILPVVLGAQGQIVDAGPARRLFPAPLRRAIIARDRGCAAPGCGQPATYCQVHHVQHYEHGGPTTVENGVLLCEHHHQAVHHDQYRIHMRHGIPWFEDTSPTARSRQASSRTGAEPELTRNQYWADHPDPPW
ncbi:HNH endonuclease signature motif containing protein [Micrococcus terreus]|uniref:HNH endonuclease signature motif containing protein n=1 Tax=Micrococcus terreus TaxID=574650 RepID=UPI00254E80C9|nr:HNH endonuclease signature motif containing protein [Micrococcus terreus]MDK7701213.1 HNH endonuclease signature motif containing protein [Micrococcus terreus]WOO97778.1 HNH endonuclease signature motif containing protein [Micrococcus terreus]